MNDKILPNEKENKRKWTYTNFDVDKYRDDIQSIDLLLMGPSKNYVTDRGGRGR